MKVEWGSLISFDYDAVLDSGKQIGSSAVNGRLHLRIGKWRNLPGLASKLVGLEEGDERLIRLSPAEAFGEWDPDASLTMRESRLGGDNHLEDGDTIRVETVGGCGAVCRVYRLDEDRVALDFNHPLAGEPLTLFVRVMEVAQPS